MKARQGEGWKEDFEAASGLKMPNMKKKKRGG
jgi:hypothetical protein